MGDLTKRGDLEPEGMVEHHELRCRRCGAFALERPVIGSFRFDCARYWRGPWSSHCWTCAVTESAFDSEPVPGQMDLFEAAS